MKNSVILGLAVGALVVAAGYLLFARGKAVAADTITAIPVQGLPAIVFNPTKSNAGQPAAPTAPVSLQESK